MWFSLSDSEKILLLRIRKRRLKFLSRVNGSLAQKTQQGAQARGLEVKETYSADLRNCFWKYVPRAKVAVRMHFFSEGRQIPALHNLVKYYLDPLKGVVFADDRQVHHLTAMRSRIADPFDSGPAREDSVYTEVERLGDYKDRLSIFSSHLSDHRDELEADDPHRELERIVEQIEETDYEALGLASDALDRLRTFDKMQFQVKLLALNRIGIDDVPGTSSLAKFVPDAVRELRRINPFAIDLGDLPRTGESAHYRQRIRSSIQAFKAKQRNLGSIIVPLELDVQVTPRALRLGKDLDNILRDVCPVLQEEMLRGDSYIHAYRVYVTNRLSSNDPGSIRVKLLPQYGIQRFEIAVDQLLETVADELD